MSKIANLLNKTNLFWQNKAVPYIKNPQKLPIIISSILGFLIISLSTIQFMLMSEVANTAQTPDILYSSPNWTWSGFSNFRPRITVTVKPTATPIRSSSPGSGTVNAVIKNCKLGVDQTNTKGPNYYQNLKNLGTCHIFNWHSLSTGDQVNAAGMEFHPMVWGCKKGWLELPSYEDKSITYLQAYKNYATKHPGSRWLMFNEPELKDSTNPEYDASCTPEEAVEVFSEAVEAIKYVDSTAQFGCCGNIVPDKGWMDNFITAYNNIKKENPPLDYLHIHLYGAKTSNPDLVPDYRNIDIAKTIVDEFNTWEAWRNKRDWTRNLKFFISEFPVLSNNKALIPNIVNALHGIGSSSEGIMPYFLNRSSILGFMFWSTAMNEVCEPGQDLNECKNYASNLCLPGSDCSNANLTDVGKAYFSYGNYTPPPNGEPTTCTISQPTMISAPANGAILNNSQVTFSWNSVPGADRYVFEICDKNDSRFASCHLNGGGSYCCVNQPSNGTCYTASTNDPNKWQSYDDHVLTGTSKTLNLAPGEYIWKLVSHSSNNEGCFSSGSIKTFKITGGSTSTPTPTTATSCVVSQPTINSPVANVTLTNSSINISWNKISNADRYVVELRQEGTYPSCHLSGGGSYCCDTQPTDGDCDSKDSLGRITAFDSHIISKDTSSLNLNLAPGSYDLAITAHATVNGVGCFSPRSEMRKFKVNSLTSCLNYGSRCITSSQCCSGACVGMYCDY